MNTPNLSNLPTNRNVRVLASHPCGIFAFEKPSGIMTHPNAPGVAAAKNAMLIADYSLKHECYFCRGDDGAVQKIFVLNRLDSPTSGIVLCATSEVVARLVRRAFLEDRVDKTYLAVVCGNAPEKCLWRDWLIREKTNDGSLRVKIAANAKLRGAQFAETELVRECSGDGNFAKGMEISLVKLLPHTGRTHQLRVQCAAHGLPILGDRTYGNTDANKAFAHLSTGTLRERLFLHAGATSLMFPWRGSVVEFFAESILPESFTGMLLNKNPRECSRADNVPEKDVTESLSRFRLRLKR